MLIGLVAVAAVIYYVSRNEGFSSSSRSNSPEEILKRRFVEGEIDEREYREKRDALRR